MRGLAALFVFFCHYFYTCFVIAEGWGYGDSNYNLLKLPFLRLFYAGPPMVCVFFVISGYALSLKPLKLMRSKDGHGQLSNTMASLIFRRGIRLFLPTVVSTFLIFCLLRLGLYEWTREFAYDDEYMPNVQEIHYERFDSFADQLYDWLAAVRGLVHVWDWDAFASSTGMDVHLWTIPVEFRASMMLFLTIMGVARLRTWCRVAVIAGSVVFAYASDRWEMMLFYAGMGLAEMDIIRGAHADPRTTAMAVAVTVVDERKAAAADEHHLHLPLPLSTRKSNKAPATTVSKRYTATHLAWLTLSILALYFMSQPDTGSDETPGWVFLSSLIPEWWTYKYRYWQSLGSILFVLSVGRLPVWQRFFNTSLVQYFGKISYAIYLMHGPVLHTVGYAIERRVWTSVTGIEGSWYNVGFVVAALFIVPIVFWVSDVFWRAVDAPIVRFSRWVEGMCSAEEAR